MFFSNFFTVNKDTSLTSLCITARFNFVHFFLPFRGAFLGVKLPLETFMIFDKIIAERVKLLNGDFLNQGKFYEKVIFFSRFGGIWFFGFVRGGFNP